MHNHCPEALPIIIFVLAGPVYIFVVFAQSKDYLLYHLLVTTRFIPVFYIHSTCTTLVMIAIYRLEFLITLTESNQ